MTTKTASLSSKSVTRDGSENSASSASSSSTGGSVSSASNSKSESASRTRSSSTSKTRSSEKSGDEAKKVVSRGRSREPRSRSPNRIKQAPHEDKVVQKTNKSVAMKSGDNKSKTYVKDENIQQQQQQSGGGGGGGGGGTGGGGGGVGMREEKNIKNENKTNGEKIVKRSKVADLSQSFSKRLYVGNLTRNVSEEHIKEIFSLWGVLANAEIALDRQVQLSKGYAYVEYEKREEAENALKHMNGAQIDGNVIEVKFVYVPQRREPVMDNYGISRARPRPRPAAATAATATEEHEAYKRREQDIRPSRITEYRRRSPPRQRSPLRRTIRRSRSPIRPSRPRYYNRSPLPRRPPINSRKGYAYDRPIRRPRTRSPIESRRKYSGKRKSPKRNISTEREGPKVKKTATKSSSYSRRGSLSSSSSSTSSSVSKKSK